MHEDGSEVQQELSTKQEQELVDKILEFKPYLEDFDRVPGLVATYKLSDISVALYINNNTNLSKEALHSSVVVSQRIPGTKDWHTQDTYLISRNSDHSTKLSFDREYMRLVFNEDGKPFMERFPTDIKELSTLAAESTDKEHQRHIYDLIEIKRQEDIDFAKQFGAVGHGFTVERFNELMSILGSINPETATPNVPIS